MLLILILFENAGPYPDRNPGVGGGGSQYFFINIFLTIFCNNFCLMGFIL